MFLIKAIGPGQKSTGGERGALLVVSSLQQIIFLELFVSGVVVDDGDGALGADVVVVAGDVILDALVKSRHPGESRGPAIL